jgi:DnaJ-domain-containing protein 1
MARLLFILAIAAALYFWWLEPRRAAHTTVGRLILAAAAAVFAIAYLRSPVDLIPDASGIAGLIDDLAVLVGASWWIKRVIDGARPAAESAGREEHETRSGWDPHAVLGIGRGASAEEINAAYRRRMKEYHPDRVNDLGEDLRRVAHEKTLEIQRAYDELKSR